MNDNHSSKPGLFISIDEWLEPGVDDGPFLVCLMTVDISQPVEAITCESAEDVDAAIGRLSRIHGRLEIQNCTDLHLKGAQV